MTVAVTKRLTGRIAAENIKLMAVPRAPQGAVERLIALGDPTGIISDTMDELGIPSGVIGASVLRPTIPGRTIAGPALTVRNILQRIDPLEGARRQVNRMAEFEAHNLAQPGDVLVIQGVAGVSSMGGVSASIGKRQGEAGAIVDGAVRDIDHSRGIGYPVWSSSVSPMTGKWRIETLAVNKPVTIAGVAVKPGDLVIADEVGVCFIPYPLAADVLAVAQRLMHSEKERLQKLAAGISLPDYVK